MLKKIKYAYKKCSYKAIKSILGRKKIFGENSFQPLFTYDGTLVSFKKSEKTNDTISRKSQKASFLGHFWPKKFFSENRSPSHSRVHGYSSLCKKSKKTNDPISRKAGNERTNGRTQVNL